MDIQDEASDRHRRITAIIDEIVPVRITQLGDVAAEGFEKIEGMLRREVAFGLNGAERDTLGDRIALAHQRPAEILEQRKLPVGRRGLMIGDIVGRTHEIVESHDGRTMARRNQE